MGRGITRRSFHTDGDSRVVRCGLDALSSVTIPRPSSCMFGNGRSDGCSDAQSSAQRAGSMPEVVPKAVPEETVEAMPEAIRSHAGAPVRVTAAVEIRDRGHSCGLKRQMEFQSAKKTRSPGHQVPAGKMCSTRKDKAPPAGGDETE